MVDVKRVEKQLKRIKFDSSIWNRAEARELPSILHEKEQIFECANGYYEGGFALLVSTDMRVLLIDKKPFNYLTVEDLRFDMINEIDYSHRIFGATITIATGSKTLRFKSYNQPRLRKLINHVQHRMADIKAEAEEKTATQQHNLEEINKQLQMYLLAQQQQLQKQIQAGHDNSEAAVDHIKPLKPSPQLSDYLFAQRLLEQFQAETVKRGEAEHTAPFHTSAGFAGSSAPPATQLDEDLVAAGQREIFGKAIASAEPVAPAPTEAVAAPVEPATLPANPVTPTVSIGQLPKSLEINPLKIAYSKLPMMLRNRKFGRPSYHAHSQAPTPPSAVPQAQVTL